ncbi:hypothetical protein HMPREF0298_1241 [Corynebacterium lipophiloflavum DSM 44291]|uniref:Uncharacterized protein n=2 Tax=Corynebacterium lipophiloflavum TaxID=161889 RepID=C0XS21_CORLD|nr:hypothetical protein HMPREF0298_1241 [Corynebacterium lipophiloflavum DSM 44291]
MLASTVALTGCSRSAPDPVAEVPAFVVDAPSVTLVESGTDPRLLQFDDSDDSQPWQTEVRVLGGIDQSVQATDTVDEQAPAGGDVNRTSLPLSVTAQPAPAPGEGENDVARRIDFTVGSGSDSDLGIGQDVATAEGFLMSWRADASGRVDTLKLFAPPESSSTGRQIVESSLLAATSTNVVFPTEPVGVGGSWTVTSRITGEASMRRTTTYTVTGIDGDTVTLDISVDERPTQQEVTIDNEVAGELNGASLRVDATSTTSEGEITVDLRHPLPVAGAVKATTRVIYAGPRPETRVVQDITSAVEYGG